MQIMAKRKITLPEQAQDKSRDADIKDAEVGDFCYYLNERNKISWGEIQKVICENGLLGFHIICQTEYRHYTIPHVWCSFDKKALKGKKREHFNLNFKNQ